MSHLSPLYLRLCFPPEYPSAALPVAQLSAIWLTPDSAQLLRDQLEDLWHEQVRQNSSAWCSQQHDGASCR